MLSFYCKIGNVNRIEKVTTIEEQSSYKKFGDVYGSKTSLSTYLHLGILELCQKW